MNIDVTALKAVEREKGIPADTVIEAIESALVTAYRHADGAAKHVRVHVDRKSGEVAVLAQELGPDGEVVREWDDTPSDFGRIAASTAKQVIVQRLRDAEHEQTFGEYAGKEGDIVSGIVQAHDRRNVQGTVLIDIGKVEAVLPQSEQVPGEAYTHGSRIKAYVVSVARTFRGPQVTVSRTHPHLVRKLFALEVPEIADGSVEIVAVAREAGHRSKIAVRTKVPGLNAKGACIGPMGQRVRNVMSELHGEKIDIVDWSDDPATFVASALSPARVTAPGSSTRRPRRSASSSPTTSSRWPSARKGRTPAWPPGSPAAGSTSAATRRPRTTPPPPRRGWAVRRCDPGAPGSAGRPGAAARPPAPSTARGTSGAGHALDFWVVETSFPVRTCVGCRKRAPANELLRVVVRSGALVPDPRRRLPGRGASVHPTPECLHAAERRRAFPRALRLPGGSAPLETGPLRHHVGASTEAPGARPGAGDNRSSQSDRHQAGPHVDRTPSDDSAVKFSR